MHISTLPADEPIIVGALDTYLSQHIACNISSQQHTVGGDVRQQHFGKARSFSENNRAMARLGAVVPMHGAVGRGHLKFSGI